MKIYKDSISGDKLFSDDFPKRVEHDIVWVVPSPVVRKNLPTEEEFNIGSNNDEDDEDQTISSESAIVIKLVDTFRLVESPWDKKSYMTYIKSYMKNLQDKLKKENPERVNLFTNSASSFVELVLDNFNDYAFYQGDSMDPYGMVVLMKYAEDQTPEFYFFVDGLVEEESE